MARWSRLGNFFLQRKFCVSARVGKSLEKYLLSKAFRRPRRKVYISGNVWRKSFNQTVKYSFFSKIIVNQSFYGALITFRDFFLQRKFCVSARVGKSLEKYLLSKAFRRPCGKNYISGNIWRKSFIQTVKYSFFSKITVNQSFYGALLTFYNFFFKEKLFVSARGSRQVAWEVFIV